MRIAVITDLHANREAVEAVMDHAQGQGITRHAFVGDFVGYGADPAWVVDMVAERVRGGDLAVQGNHDMAVVRGASPTMRLDAKRVVEWTRAQLDEAQLAFLANLPLSITLGELLFVHANAYDPAAWDYVQGRGEAQRSMQATRQRITFVGHMHEPQLFHLSPAGKTGDFTPVAGEPIPLLPPRQWLVIPGSAGQPRDGNPAACYAVYDDARREITYWRVPYDHEGAGAKIRAADLPQALATRLADGR
ncbi:Metallophosphoesterase [Rubrivivax sp. A210]|uniref:metallophosphoesterase family protein n=1 Tax=Rubrivivax sp. A210 TaxID=2772301 RepID=UPI00191983B2|nr:metallophosphoesterase family protein [Rubrivivax sp. A210]CAD5374508.1 Metallophosphoesterase [Rubrivivax sp. A210]